MRSRGARPVLPDKLPRERPEQPKLDELVREMLEATGESEAVATKVMELTDVKKWVRRAAQTVIVLHAQ